MTVSEPLSGQNLDRVVSGTEQAAGLNMNQNGQRVFGCPACVIKVTNSLLKCAHDSASRTGDTVAYKETEEFTQLHRSEITDRLLSADHAT